MPGSSAENQDDIDSESDDETKRSPFEQKKFIVFEDNLDVCHLFYLFQAQC